MLNIMKVKSRYNLNDTVWYFSNNYVQSGIVNGIFFHVTREGDQERTNVEYTLSNDESHLAEEILFPGKKELLNSL